MKDDEILRRARIIAADPGFYVEARVGSNNYRGQCCRAVYDGARFNDRADDTVRLFAERIVADNPIQQDAIMSLGRIGYEAYCKASGGVSLVSGAKLPEWPALSDEIKNAWECAAESIIGYQMMGSPDAV